MKKYIHLFIATFLVLAAAGMIFFWEAYLEDKINTIAVVVAARNIEKDQLISRDDLKLQKIKVGQVVEKPITNIDDILGKQASQYVVKEQQFVSEMINENRLVPRNDQMIFPIPKEWIYSVPGSLRRGDHVFVYAVPDEKRRVRGSVNMSVNKTGSNSAVAQGNFEVTASVYKGNGNNDPVLKDVIVSFAKDSTNQEVKPAQNSEKRIDATGSISNLELIITQNQYNAIESKYLEGFKFNFAYK